MSGDAATLMGIYGKSGFMSLIGILEVVFGAALLAGKYIPLSLTILIAILFNAAAFHALNGAMDSISRFSIRINLSSGISVRPPGSL